jgi:hypothetical protein
MLEKSLLARTNENIKKRVVLQRCKNGWIKFTNLHMSREKRYSESALFEVALIAVLLYSY